MTTITFSDLYAYLDENIQDKASTDPHHLVREFSERQGLDADALIPILEGFGGYDDHEVLFNVVGRIQEDTVIGRPIEENVLCKQSYSPHLVNALVNYATAIVKGRWERAEKIILDCSPKMSTDEAVDRAYGVERYSVEVIKGRWEEGEALLLASTHAMLTYAEEVVKGRLPDHLHVAMVLGTPDDAVREYIAKYGVA